MRKVTYTIDDKKYFEADLHRQKPNITAEEVEAILAYLRDFKAIYTLYGDEKFPDRYTLTDFNEKKISLDSLNGYQKACILNDCMRHFSGKSCAYGDVPCGVISIEEGNSNEDNT